MRLTLQELAGLVGGAVKRGDPGLVLTGAAGIESAGPADVSFLADLKRAKDAAATKAGALLVGRDFAGETPAALVAADHPHLAFVKVLALLEGERRQGPKGVHPSAVVHPEARVDPSASIGALCVVEARASVGAGAVLYPQVYVGHDAAVGKDCLLYPNVTVRERCELGDRVIVHPGAVIGADGYGFVQDKGVHHKVPQVGRVVIEDDVELGANVCVDRATVGETRIGRGTKVDNLVQIAHNVTVGKGCLIVSFAGIAGSSSIGDYTVLAGRAGVKDHVKVGAKAMVLGGAGVIGDIEDGAVVWGLPARPYREQMKIQALVQRLPELFDDVKALKKEGAKG